MGHSEQTLSKDLDESFEQVVEQLQQFFVAVTTNFTHGRGTHTYGTAARGQAKIIVPAGFPENDFLTFGNSYPVVTCPMCLGHLLTH